MSQDIITTNIHQKNAVTYVKQTLNVLIGNMENLSILIFHMSFV